MKVKRMSPHSYKNLKNLLPLEIKDLTILWCDDGWSYIPARYVRFRYIHSNETYEEVSWTGAIPARVEYEEHIKWTLYSNSPKIWKEEAKEYSELFVENG